MEIIYSPQFARAYRKLPGDVKVLAEQRVALFRENPFNPALDTHKLHGHLREFWSFSVGRRYRIIFEFGHKNAVCFHTVGSHDIYEHS